MRQFHNIHISVFCHAGEDENKILEKFCSLFPFKIDKYLVREEATGLQKDSIIIYKVSIDKESETNKLMQFLMDNLGEDQKQKLYYQLPTRIDDELHFFLRLDKEAMLNDKYLITDSGDCFHIKALVAAYPKRRDRAEEIIARYLNV